jgi:hypothetical protein
MAELRIEDSELVGGGFGKDFAVVHGHGPGVVVEVAGEEYARLLVSMADADVIATHLATVATSG